VARDLDIRNPRSILVVDDDDDVREALKLLLDASDLPVIGEATNGVEAGYMAYRHQPAIVILDYQMPKLTGAETSYVVRFLAPHSKIIAFSTLLEARPSWADAFLSKDSIGQMASLIETILMWPSGDGHNGDGHRGNGRRGNGYRGEGHRR
jgi:DNA-binding NarL/FixJ family response regulator